MATKKKRKKVVLVEFGWRVSTIKRLAAAKGISFYALILFVFGIVAKVTFKYGLEIMLLILLPLIAPAAGPNGKSVLYSLNNSDI